MSKSANLNRLPLHFKVNADHCMYLWINLILSKDYQIGSGLIFILNPFWLIFYYQLLLLFENDYLFYFLLFLLIGFENFAGIKFYRNLLLLGSYFELFEYFKVENYCSVLNLLWELNSILMELVYDFIAEDYLYLNKLSI